MTTPRPFTDTLRALGHGECLDQLTDGLHELVGAVEQTGRAGSITLTVQVKRGPGKAGTVIVTDDVSLKLPKPEKRQTIMFVTPENNLVTTDPRQQALTLTDATGPAPALVETSTTAATLKTA